MNAAADEAPPPGEGVTTFTTPVVGADSMACGTVAVISAEEIKIVARAWPLKLAIDRGVKLLPVKVMPVSEEPAKTVAGVRAVRIGVGYSRDTTAVPDLLLSSWLIPVIEIEFPPAGMVTGAVYRPDVEIVPTEELPLATPFTNQFTEFV